MFLVSHFLHQCQEGAREQQVPLSFTGWLRVLVQRAKSMELGLELGSPNFHPGASTIDR